MRDLAGLRAVGYRAVFNIRAGMGGEFFFAEKGAVCCVCRLNGVSLHCETSGGVRFFPPIIVLILMGWPVCAIAWSAGSCLQISLYNPHNEFVMDERVKPIVSNATDDMEGALMFLDEALAHIRAGKANVRIVDGVRVDYYGSMVPISNVSNVSTPDAKTIQIQPWEKSMIPVIEKALINSEIGITPVNNGEVVRLCFPPVTEERRRQLVKTSNAAGEEAKVSIRNARREAIDKLKKEIKNGMPEDVEKDGEGEVQKVHDLYVKKVEEMLSAKEKEIMTI